MKIAHVNKLDKNNSMKFHINYLAEDKRLELGSEVFASVDNGYHGFVAKIDSIGESTLILGNSVYPIDFVSIEYTCKYVNEE